MCWYVYLQKKENGISLDFWELWHFYWTMSIVVLFLDGPYQFDFVILVAGFKSRQKQHDSLYLKPITTPSLHVFGDTDKVIPKGKK